MRTRAVLAFVSVVAVSGLAAGEDLVQLAPLHVIPTENQSAQPIAADDPARVRLSSTNPQALAEVLGVSLAANQATFEYVIDQYPQLRSAGTRTWLEPTFVIDFTEPEFEPLRKELEARATKPTRQQLVEYVASLIEASDERDWDLASVVAHRRKGDCSEHAVLTAALARLLGIPARVVVGVALVSDEKNHGAFGHAWAEIFEDGKWKVADAALLGQQGAVRYLPVGLIEDEGMGYAMGLIGLLQIW
ncbi:MAG TPA: transglutaminase-like domain-containing protein, partial [Steroidobacteraceae bacterium]|nr:transglutaminase-like domain-containing protein [Steroidobacteraceae bacterium]